jgi:hypothetical protein
MRSIFDDFDNMAWEDEGEKVFLFQGEFPGYEREPVHATILKQEERYYTLNLIGADLSPIVAKKRGKRIAIAMEVFFETRIPGKFNEPVVLGKGEAFYFPSDNALYIQDLYIRQAPGKIGRIIQIHKHTNTIRLWKSFEKYLRETFPEAQHITTPLQDTSHGSFTALLRSLGYKKLNYLLFQKPL